MVFVLGMRLHVHMRTRFENGIPHKFEAMKTLSGCKAVYCDKHQFCAEPFSSYHRLTSGLNKEERIRKMALLLPHTFAFSCLPRGFWATMSLADHKSTQSSAHKFN